MGIFSAASVELMAMAKSLRICIHSSLRSVQARSSKPKNRGRASRPARAAPGLRSRADERRRSFPKVRLLGRDLCLEQR